MYIYITYTIIREYKSMQNQIIHVHYNTTLTSDILQMRVAGY